MVKNVSKGKARGGGRGGAERDKGPTPKKNSVKNAVSDAPRADLELVARFKDGDLGAFDLIFETYSGPLLGFLTRMCGDPEDAKEGLQDTFLSVFRYLKDFRGEATLKNWIFRIAVTSCLKKKRRMKELSCEGTEGDPCDPAGAAGSANPVVASQGSPAWRTDPETLAQDGEFRRTLVQGVASMPYIYKVVINLRDFEGFSTQEVSRLLQIKESTVKVRLHRARLYLQDWLKRHYHVPDRGGPHGRSR